MMWTTEIRRWPLPVEFVDEWRALEAASVSPSFFRTPEWVLARVEALGLEGALEVHVWREGHVLRAVLATMRSRERLHHRVPLGVSVTELAASGVGGADHTGWSGGDASHSAIRSWLAAQRGSVLLRNLDVDLAEAAGLVPFTVERSRCPRLDLTTWDGPPSSFRKKIAYYRRRAAREGYELVVAEAGRVEPRHLDELQQLHDLRFGETSGLSDASFAIQQRLLERASSDVGPVVVELRRDERTLAILWGFWFAGAFAFYQTGWNDECRDLSPGALLVDEAIGVARRLGATTFDFLRGPEEYKYRFGASDRVDHTVLLPRGVGGAALRAKAKLRDHRAASDASASG